MAAVQWTGSLRSRRQPAITSISGAPRFDLLDEHFVKLNAAGSGYELTFTVASSGPVWIRVWSPYVTAPWTLTMSVQ